LFLPLLIFGFWLHHRGIRSALRSVPHLRVGARTAPPELHFLRHLEQDSFAGFIFPVVPLFCISVVTLNRVSVLVGRVPLPSPPLVLATGRALKPAGLGLLSAVSVRAVESQELIFLISRHIRWQSQELIFSLPQCFGRLVFTREPVFPVLNSRAKAAPVPDFFCNRTTAASARRVHWEFFVPAGPQVLAPLYAVGRSRPVRPALVFAGRFLSRVRWSASVPGLRVTTSCAPGFSLGSRVPWSHYRLSSEYRAPGFGSCYGDFVCATAAHVQRAPKKLLVFCAWFIVLLRGAAGFLVYSLDLVFCFVCIIAVRCQYSS
jgi:hypothetical protein